MSDNARRAVIIGGVLVIFIVAFVVFRPSDDPDETAATPTPAEQTPTPTPADAESTATATPTPTPRPQPKYEIIRVQGLEPVGGVKELEYDKGDTVRIKVRSDREEEAHLHGFDISKPVGPGKTAAYDFKADLEGVYELELENSAVPIAELTINP